VACPMRPIAALALTLTLLACEKKEEANAAPDLGHAAASAGPSSAPPPASTAPSAAPTVVPSASAPPPAPRCPAGLTANAMPAYCIKLPPGYTVKESRISPARGDIDYETGTSTDHLTVTYESTPVAELSKQVEGEMKFGGDKLEKKGDLPGGNKWFQGSHAEYARIVTLVQAAPPITLKCSFAYQPKKAPSRLAIDACKSVAMP
jgi:hypothetical protein